MIGPAIYFGVVAILLAGSIRKPAFALGAFLCMFGLEQWGAAKIGFVASHVSFTNYLASAIVMIAFGVRLLRGRGFRVVNGPIHLSVILLYTYAAVSLVWTPAPDIAMEEWRASAPYLLVSILVLPLLVQDVDEAAKGLHGTLIAGAILNAALVFLVEWGYRGFESEVFAGVAIRTPLAIAQLGAIVFVLSIIYMPWRGLYAVVAIGLIAISVILVIKSGSRGQLIAMIAGAFLFVPIARGWSISRGYVLWLIAVAVMLAAIWATLLPDLSSVITDEEGRYDTDQAMGDYEERVTAAETLLKRYLSSGVLELLFGLGNSASFSPHIIGHYTHIVSVEILCELGIVGFSLFITILALSVRAIARFIATASLLPRGADARRVVASLAALALLELLVSFKQGSLIRDVNLFLFPILIEGIIASVRAKHRMDRTPDVAIAKSPVLKDEKRVVVSPVEMETQRER
jgi:hypothetical protein